MKKQFFSWRAAILDSQELQATTKHVLLTLSCHMNDAGESCYPSIELLCNETGLSNRTVITHLQLANELGWIETSKHGFAGKQWARNEYRISWPKVVNEVHYLDQEGGETSSLPSDGEAVKEVHHLNDKAVNLTTEGSEPDDIKVVKEVHTISSVNSSKSTPNIAPAKISGNKPKLKTLRTFLDECKANGVKAIAHDDPIFKYASRVGLADDMLLACWLEFKTKYVDTDKKYTKWQQTFGNAVRGNWFKFWFVKGGVVSWTSLGEQAFLAIKNGGYELGE